MTSFLKKISLFCLFLMPLFSFSQNLTGIWQGTATEISGAATPFAVTFYLVQTGNSVSGTSWNYLDLQPYFSEKNFIGTKQENTLKFEETAILSQILPEKGQIWSISYGNFTHDVEADLLSGELIFQPQNQTASINLEQPTTSFRAFVKLSRK
jgi:hypothetical protein